VVLASPRAYAGTRSRKGEGERDGDGEGTHQRQTIQLEEGERDSRGRRKDDDARARGGPCSSPAWAPGSYSLLQSSSTSPPRPLKQVAPTEATSGTTASGDPDPYESWSWETRKRQR